MPRKYKPISCSKSDITSLNLLAADQSNPRLALRARIILLCAEGKQVKDIAEELSERPNTVILWRNRFSERGLEGLKNLPRGKNAFRYGNDARDRILSTIKEPPPNGMSRWTGQLLSKELSIPAAVIWRHLREEGISLSASPAPEPAEFDIEIPLQFTFRKERAMNKPSDRNNEMMDLEITAKITASDGTVIEKKVRLADAIPGFDDFDFKTKEGFLRDFDKLERAIIAARDEVSRGIAEEYGEHLSKKNRKMTK